MEETTPLLVINRPDVIWRQIGNQLRSKVLSGELLPGTKLPSTAAIAKESNTDVKTVHRALSLLVKEGLITRRRKVGTFVTERKKTISPIGIYASIGVPAPPQHTFLHHLIVELQQEAQRRRMSTVVWNDPRPESEAHGPLPEIEDAVRGGRINSLIAVNAHPGRADWIEKLHVPSTVMGKRVSATVTFDYAHFLNLALSALKDKGCRSVAVITNIDPHRLDKPFLEACEKFGLNTREDYVIHKPTQTDVDLERFGYEGFKKLWALTPFHPEGVVVFPDLSARGAVMAALGSGVRIGDDLHLALHQNEGIDIFCPVPASLIVSSVRECAKALIMQVERQLKGARLEPFAIKYRATESAGCDP